MKDNDRTLLWAVGVSILVHVLLLVPGLRGIIPEDFFKAESQAPVAEPIEFELVSPPETPTPTDQKSRYLSTVSSAASDVVETEDKTDLPHSEGVVPIVDTPSQSDGAEGGGQSEVPPLKQEATDLGEAFERSKFLAQQSPNPSPSLPEQTTPYRNQSSTQATVGGISLNTTAWDFAPYLLDLRQRIKQQWIPPLAFTALGAIHGYTKINFKIYPDGSLHDLTIIDTRGHESLHKSSRNAIKGAAPFRSLPDDFPEDYLEITFGFYYLLPGDEDDFFKKE